MFAAAWRLGSPTQSRGASRAAPRPSTTRGCRQLGLGGPRAEAQGGITQEGKESVLTRWCLPDLSPVVPADPTQNGGRLRCALTCRSHGPVLVGVWLPLSWGISSRIPFS